MLTTGTATLLPMSFIHLALDGGTVLIFVFLKSYYINCYEILFETSKRFGDFLAQFINFIGYNLAAIICTVLDSFLKCVSQSSYYGSVIIQM